MQLSSKSLTTFTSFSTGNKVCHSKAGKTLTLVILSNAGDLGESGCSQVSGWGLRQWVGLTAVISPRSGESWQLLLLQTYSYTVEGENQVSAERVQCVIYSEQTKH